MMKAMRRRQTLAIVIVCGIIGAVAYLAVEPLVAAERGYHAVGGEAILLLLPVLALLARAVIEEARDES